MNIHLDEQLKSYMGKKGLKNIVIFSSSYRT